MKGRRGLLQELSLTPVINAFETVTAYGGSLMPEEVLSAMVEVSGRFVDIRELNRRVGERIAELTGNEAAIVVGGCAAGLALSVAAAITGPDPRVVDSFSPESNRGAEVVVFRGQRNPYDRALTLPGTKLVEFGYPTHQARTAQLENAITENTVAVFYFAGGIFQRYALSIEETARVAHSKGVPVFVDGAAQVPPKANLWRYTAAGADLALFSVGKGIRGPQEAGLVLGKPHLVRAVELHSSPNHAFGRPMKLSKESIAGTLRAIELLMERDEEAEYERMTALARKFVAELAETDGVETTLLPTGRHGQLYPRVAVKIKKDPETPRDVYMELLREGDPPIVVGPSDDDPEAFCVNFFALIETESHTVAQRLIELSKGKKKKP